MFITTSEIREKVTTNQAWAERAILALYQFQTADEQMTDSTHHLNNVGFNAFDAQILSSFARQLERGRHLSPKQQAIAFKKMKKYAGQLKRIADAKVS